MNTTTTELTAPPRRLGNTADEVLDAFYARSQRSYPYIVEARDKLGTYRWCPDGHHTGATLGRVGEITLTPLSDAEHARISAAITAGRVRIVSVLRSCGEDILHDAKPLQ